MENTIQDIYSLLGELRNGIKYKSLLYDENTKTFYKLKKAFISFEKEFMIDIKRRKDLDYVHSRTNKEQSHRINSFLQSNNIDVCSGIYVNSIDDNDNSFVYKYYKEYVLYIIENCLYFGIDDGYIMFKK